MVKRLDDVIADVAYVLDSLRLLRDICESGNCNDCKWGRSCIDAPKAGQLARYNCPFYDREEKG